MLPVYMIFYTLVLLHLAHSYSILPEVISTQFDADGAPLRSMSRQDFAMFHVGFIVSMSCIFAAIGWAVTKLPVQFIAIPNKDYWLAPERRRATMKSLQSDLCWMGIIVGIFVFVIDYNVMDAAIRNTRGMTQDTISTIMFWMSLAVAAFVGRLLLKFRRPNGPGQPPR